MRLPSFNTVVASAMILPPRRMYEPAYNEVQDQLWDFYETLEEYAAAVHWKANLLSGIRLVAAEFIPGDDEPKILTDGPAADAIANFAGGPGGQTQLLAEMAIHLNVPGEGWLCGFYDEADEEQWRVFSADEIRIKNGVYQYRVGDGRSDWRELGDDSVVIRFWRASARRGWQARPRAAHALGAMTELDLINKRILAETASRMASNGMLIYDKDRLSIGPTPGTADHLAPDPLAVALVDVGSRGMKDPLSAEATIKIPFGVSRGDDTTIPLSDYVYPLDLSNPVTDRILEQRDSAIRRIASVLEMTTERLTGMGDLSHWGQAQVEESGIQVYVAPDMELLVHAFTTGFLVPYLEASNEPLIGPNGGKIVVWYDPSNIVQRPDRSAVATEAYDRMELSPVAYRREIGMSEGDKPTDDELDEMTDKLQRRNVTTEVIEDEDVSTETTNASAPADTEPDTSVEDESPSAPENEREVRPGG
jgi:hypothetical protein